MNNLLSRARSWLGIYGKVLGLLGAMALGALLPQLHSLSYLIRYVLMVMLFFAFLDIRLKPRSFDIGVVWVLCANLAVAWVGYRLFASTNTDLALTAFLTGIAPTAIAAPVIISFIDGRVEYVVGAVMLTNVAVALVIPFALPAMLGAGTHISVWHVLQPVLVVMFAPLAAARLASYAPSRAQAFIGRGKRFSFPIWLFNLCLISAKTAHFLREENQASLAVLLQIAVLSLVICALNFALGALIGGRRYWQEASQSLGQKNNSFVIWIALTFINPLVAMGPTFYILYHNLYNSFQVYLFEKRRARVR